MLAGRDAITMIAVKDVEVAKRFYRDTLGLPPHGEENPEFVSFKSGNTIVNVYRSRYAGTNEATTATWVVGEELDSIVDALRGKGVTFEHYDLPDTVRHGDIHVAGDIRIAWFKDPDGNILSLQNR
jgi:catechol 2,3-dioxygenase-like lactoylglutathione lyase family enzyme